eukprot:TRINITY_DN3661_c0_g1_i2.p1 TRINITY_DN3661_c0_g1~~TRINITY_DN3661_c0_g1_i2.p1  ORF type:complete len:323 (-),score=90.65 TRINITY_DN3661_c0_g1_i2:33-950(-)
MALIPLGQPMESNPDSDYRDSRAKEEIDDFINDLDDDYETSLPMKVITMDDAISSENIGYILLKKMGWKDNTGLGKDGTGIVDPIRIDQKDDKLGLGKAEVDAFYIQPENVKRKALDTEVTETPELVKTRQEITDRKEAIQQEVQAMNKTFFCELCQKQYKLATELEGHLSSYDHAHKQRFKDMKEKENLRKRGSMKTKKEKQQRRDDKEAKKLHKVAAQACGASTGYSPSVPMTRGPPSSSLLSQTPPPVPTHAPATASSFSAVEPASVSLPSNSHHSTNVVVKAPEPSPLKISFGMVKRSRLN